MININYASIRSMDISNGEGVGVALFVQGCPFNPHCHNCFNPETWDFNGGKEWTPEVKEKFLELVDKSYIKRVSLLGGECLAEENLDDVLDLVTEINKRYNTPQDIVCDKDNNNNMLNENVNKIRILFTDKVIWIYSGYTYEEITNPKTLDESFKKRQEIISKCDVLVDGRYIDSQRDISLKWRGSSNQRVIDLKESIKQNKVILYTT